VYKYGWGVDMVNCNFTVGVSPEMLAEVEKKRGSVSRSKIVAELLQMWIEGKIALDVKPDNTNEEDSETSK
jgi:metal-responsive CopG/Arc/MetJ family transcriptional regulator